jgi:hypothetical protein
MFAEFEASTYRRSRRKHLLPAGVQTVVSPAAVALAIL